MHIYMCNLNIIVCPLLILLMIEFDHMFWAVANLLAQELVIIIKEPFNVIDNTSKRASLKKFAV